MKRYAVVILIIALCPVLPRAALAESAQQSAARAKDLLAKGDLEGAMRAYQAAAQTDQDNGEYRQQFAMVRQALQMRQRLQTEQDLERWEYMGRALHSFYVRQGLYPAALEIASQMHERLNSETSALVVAETALAMDKGDVAAQTLSALKADQATPVTKALLGVALVRQGKADAARQIAQSVQLPEDAGVPAVYAAARLHASTGNTKAALASLVRVFESVPPSRLEGYKNHAKACPEFASMAATSQFAAALQTESKVPESKCSGGSSCAGCPMRGRCSHGQGSE